MDLSPLAAKIDRFDVAQVVRVALGNYSIYPPRVVVIGAAVFNLYDGFQEKYPLMWIAIQNNGLNPLKIALNDDASANNYNIILGVGSTIQLSKFEIKKVSVFSDTGTTIAVTVAVNPFLRNKTEYTFADNYIPTFVGLEWDSIVGAPVTDVITGNLTADTV